ncbi:MAG TPA: response regulator transcription factor [Coleofasciculaceae cyanobacterium]|jgi:DNA-binding NarL/FixJ family response regulator
MTTVLIVDDLGSIREFLKINLSSEPNIQIIGLANNGEKAIALVEKYQPDVVLMDINMPGKLDGIQATEKIVQRFPQIKVVLLTSQDDREQLNLALKAGSRGYVLKNTNVKDIASIIRLTKKGFFQIGPILGNWDGSLHKNMQSNNGATEIIQNPHKVKAIVQQDIGYANNSSQASEMNHILSNLTSGLFQLQETIKSQENTIVNLTNQYSLVQQEIRTKLNKNKRTFNSSKATGYSYKIASTSRTKRQQHILFISSFFLGVFTVLILMLLITTLGAVI